MPSFTYPNGVVTPYGACVVVQVTDDNGVPVPGNLYVNHYFDGSSNAFGTDWNGISVCRLGEENAIFVVGENGDVLRIGEEDNRAEIIDPKTDGPVDQGPIREIKNINQKIYAVGMGRQVYTRNGEGVWIPIGNDIVDTTGRISSGLTSISGDESGLLLAVGYDGEIWERSGNWQQIASPTNLLLTRVIKHLGKYYASGLAGTILCRETEGWKVIDTEDFTFDIWDLASFKGSLYIGTEKGLFTMDDKEEVASVSQECFTRQKNCASLSSDSNSLWCFGSDVISRTTDGIQWDEISIL